MVECIDDKISSAKNIENLRGLAMLVPLNTLEATGEEIHDDVMPEPGAYTSTHFPLLLNDDLASVSVFVVEPTVMAEVADAGE